MNIKKNVYRLLIVIIGLSNIYFAIMYGRVDVVYIYPGLFTFSLGTLIVYFMPRVSIGLNSRVEPLYFIGAMGIGLVYLLWSLIEFDIIRVIISILLMLEAYFLFKSNYNKYYSKY